MLTIKYIREHRDEVVQRLAVKHFAEAENAIAQLIDLDDRRRAAQQQLDACLAEQNATAKAIGQLMASGRTEEANAAKQQTADLKERSKRLAAELDELEQVFIITEYDNQ